MNDKKNEISRRNKLIKTLKEEYQQKVLELGALYLEEPAPVEGGAGEIHERGNECRDEAGEIKAKAARIKEISVLLEEVDEKRTELDRDLKGIGRDREALVLEIGQTAFTLYRKNPDEMSSFMELFSPAVREAAETERLEEELRSAEKVMGSTSLLKKLPIVAGIAKTRLALSGIQKGKDETLRRIGSTLAREGRLQEISGSAMEKLVDRYEKLMKSYDTLEDMIDKKRDERTALDAELKELGVSQTIGRRLKELDEELEGKEKTLNRIKVEYGKAVLIQPSLRIKRSGNKGACLGRIEAIESAIEEHEAEISRMEALLSIEAMEEQNGKKSAGIMKIRRKIEEGEKEIGALEKEIALNLDRIRKLKKIALEEAPKHKEKPDIPGKDKKDDEVSSEGISPNSGSVDSPGPDLGQGAPERAVKKSPPSAGKSSSAAKKTSKKT